MSFGADDDLPAPKEGRGEGRRPLSGRRPGAPGGRREATGQGFATSEAHPGAIRTVYFPAAVLALVGTASPRSSVRPPTRGPGRRRPAAADLCATLRRPMWRAPKTTPMQTAHVVERRVEGRGAGRGAAVEWSERVSSARLPWEARRRSGGRGRPVRASPPSGDDGTATGEHGVRTPAPPLRRRRRVRAEGADDGRPSALAVAVARAVAGAGRGDRWPRRALAVVGRGARRGVTVAGVGRGVGRGVDRGVCGGGRWPWRCGVRW